MPFNSVITRGDAEALIPVEVSNEIVQAVPQTSAVMRLGRRLPNMSGKQKRLPVMSALAMAYFVSGDTGLKQTSKAAWENRFIDAEELAVIVPIPESVLEDAQYDIWAEIKPTIVEAFGQAFDQAVLFGTNKPGTWPTALLAGAVAAGHGVTLGANGDLYADLLGEVGALSKVEQDGYSVTGHVAALTMRSRLRGLRDTTGQPIFVRTMQASTAYDLDGAPIEFPTNGCMDAAQALMFSGDWKQLVYAIRQDITYKILDQAVIQDSSGAIVYNLAQQDMVALRAVMRLGWQLPNPINRVNENSATRYPFSVLLPN